MRLLRQDSEGLISVPLTLLVFKKPLGRGLKLLLSALRQLVLGVNASGLL